MGNDFNKIYYKQPNELAIWSPISSLLAEHFLLYFEHLGIEKNIENESFICNIRYVDDRLIIYDHTKVTRTQIPNPTNSIQNKLKFRLTQGIDANICF